MRGFLAVLSIESPAGDRFALQTPARDDLTHDKAKSCWTTSRGPHLTRLAYPSLTVLFSPRCVYVCVCVQGGVVYYKSSALTGTKKDPKSIGKQAAGPFECGCRSAKKKVESASRERALKQGEIVW